MKAFRGIPILVGLYMATTVGQADASYLGAARYKSCTSCCAPTEYAACKQQCHTVMKTCREVVYEQKQYTCYKTVYEKVCEPKTIDCVNYVKEVCYRDCSYTVCKPVYETHYRTVN